MISADSHVVEPPVIFTDYLDERWREHAPQLASDNQGGECYRIPGSVRSVGLGLACTAGQSPESLRETGTTFAAVRPGAWQPQARLADQALDGITAEVIYPTIGLFLLNHVNRDFVAACMTAYNTWLSDFCVEAPDRLIGCGASAVLSPRDASIDLRRMRECGLRGALLPLEPSGCGYAEPDYDVLWSTAVETDLPLTFHALPPSRQAPRAGPAAPALLPLWEAQELLTGLVFGGVLHRFPALRLVFAEFDAGWVPHFAQRLDHYFDLHYRWLKLDSLIDRAPSEYLRQSVYFTFQDDDVALRMADHHGLNLLWASDFPHAESTWPKSGFVAEAARELCSPQSHDAAFAGRAHTLYGLGRQMPA